MGDYINPALKVLKPEEVLPKDFDFEGWFKGIAENVGIPMKVDDNVKVVKRYECAYLDSDDKHIDKDMDLYMLITQSGAAKSNPNWNLSKTFAVLIHRRPGKKPEPLLLYGFEGKNEIVEFKDSDGDAVPDVVVYPAISDDLQPQPKIYPVGPLLK